MILRNLDLKHFGKFGERSIELRRGMNLVVGPNEAGKSTLMEAIPVVLFGSRSKERHKPWHRSGSCEAALTLESEGRSVRIERDVLTDQVTLTEKDDLYHTLYAFEGKASPQGRSSEKAEYLEQLRRILGIAEEDLFRATLFFGQGQLELVRSESLSEKVKSLLSGAVEVDYDRVLSSLEQDYFAITRENPWGKDKTKDRELEEVRASIAGLEKRWYGAQDDIRQLQQVRDEMSALQQEIAADREEAAQGERYIAWARRQWQLDEKEEVLRRDFSRVSGESRKVTDLEERRVQLEAELAKTGIPRDMPEDLPILLRDAEEVRKDLIALQSEAAELRKQHLAHRIPSVRNPLLLSVLLLSLGGLSGWLRPESMSHSLWGTGLLASLVWIVFLVRAGKVHSERSRLKGQAQVLEPRREEAQARLNGLDERFERIGMSPSAVEIARMQKNFETHRHLMEELREVSSALKVLEKSTELDKARTDLTRELAVLDERMEKERPQRPANLLSPEELIVAEEKLKALGASIRERDAKLLELSRKEAAMAASVADLQQIEDEGEILKEREGVLVRRKKALAAGYELLSRSVEEFRGTYLQGFATDVGNYLSVATAGAYDQVRLDEGMTPMLPDRGGKWRPLDSFSRGTVDGVCLAVRLALTRVLAGGRALPLLLDDPLVNLDRVRRGRVLRALEQLSREHQVVLFAHDENLLRLGAQKHWNVISLDDGRRAPAADADERREDVGQLSFL